MVLRSNRPGNLWLFISIAVGHIVRILLVGVTSDTPTLLIFRTIRVQQWQRQTTWDTSRSNTVILNSWMFRSSSEFLFDIDMRKTEVKNNTRRQGWLNNRVNINPCLFQWSSEFLLILFCAQPWSTMRSWGRGWLKISGNLDPQFFENQQFLLKIGSHSGCLRQSPCLFILIFQKKSLVHFV